MSNIIQSQKTALITGAASGVGFAIAKLCRSKGMHLALLDIDNDNLVKAKEILRNVDPSLQTEAYVLDVADRGAWKEIAGQIGAIFADIDLTFDTNVFGPLNGLGVILPLVLSSGSQSAKSIVITGSKQGITNPPGTNPAYNASKAAIKSLTEHLAHDLRSDPATAHIAAHLLIPGWTWTGLMGNVGPTSESDVKKPAGAWYPSQVAEELYTGLENGSFYIICPDGETDRALDQARMKWGSADVYEERPALSRWEEDWKGRADQAIQADAKARRV